MQQRMDEPAGAAAASEHDTAKQLQGGYRRLHADVSEQSERRAKRIRVTTWAS
jgi:hypothetical protein